MKKYCIYTCYAAVFYILYESFGNNFLYYFIGCWILWAYSNHLHDYTSKITELEARIAELEKVE